MSPCPQCEIDRIPAQNLPFINADDEYYSESHEGAWVTHCSGCGRLYIRYWVEIYDDIWRYWVPVSNTEAEEVAALFREDIDAGADQVRALIQSRPHLSQIPDFDWLSWSNHASFLTGPPW